MIDQTGLFEIKGEFLLMPHKNQPDPRNLLQGNQNALNNDSGGIISAHCINSDLHNDALLRSETLLFNSKNLLTLVGSAMFADRMGSRRLAAVRTEICLNAFIAVRGNALTLFHLRHFSLWNAHFLSPQYFDA